MKKETQIILTADEGMLLTDGNQYVTAIRLPETVDEKVWHEIPKSEVPAKPEEVDIND